MARGLGIEIVEKLNRLVVGSCVPDLTVLLRIEPDRAYAREGDAGDRFEDEGLEFQRRVADAYDELAARHPERFVVIDAEGEPRAVHAEIVRAVVERR